MICDKCGQLPEFCDCGDTDWDEAAAYFATLTVVQEDEYDDWYANEWEGGR